MQLLLFVLPTALPQDWFICQSTCWFIPSSHLCGSASLSSPRQHFAYTDPALLWAHSLQGLAHCQFSGFWSQSLIPSVSSIFHSSPTAVDCACYHPWVAGSLPVWLLLPQDSFDNLRWAFESPCQLSRGHRSWWCSDFSNQLSLTSLRQVGVLCPLIGVSIVSLVVPSVDLLSSRSGAFNGVLRSPVCAQKSLNSDSASFGPRQYARMLRGLMSVSLGHQWLCSSVALGELGLVLHVE